MTGEKGEFLYDLRCWQEDLYDGDIGAIDKSLLWSTA
jgi:hypothetical protein